MVQKCQKGVPSTRPGWLTSQDCKESQVPPPGALHSSTAHSRGVGDDVAAIFGKGSLSRKLPLACKKSTWLLQCAAWRAGLSVFVTAVFQQASSCFTVHHPSCSRRSHVAQCQHPTPPQPHSGRAFAGKLSRQLVISWTGLKNVYVVRVCV